MSAASQAVEPTASGVPILRRVLSFPAALCGLLVVLSVMTVSRRFDDPDMWWHLKMGEVICRAHAIPTTDIFSWTTHHHAWTPHEWLSQVFIYAAYALGGYRGLMLWFCCMTAALLIAGYALCTLYSGNAKVSFLGALVIWMFSTVGLAIRPQMVGYLLLIVELLLIHMGRMRSPRWFYGLPPLFAIWVNCHGSFFLGLVVAATFLFCSFFDFRAGPLVARSWDRKSRWSLVLAMGISSGMLFLNPVGIKQVVYPLNLMLNQPINLSQVQEWQPLQLIDLRGIGFMGVLGSIFLLLMVKRADLYFHELLLLAAGVWLAASHVRMLFVLGILAGPVLSRLLATSWEGYDPRQDHASPNAVLLALSAVTICWAFPSRQSLAKQMNENSPVKAVEFIESRHLSGNMLNEYVYGGYLIWAAPDHPTFVDGRTDIFEYTGVLGEFGNWATLQSDPATLLDKYGVDFCLLAQKSPMVRVLPLLPNWHVLYSDPSSVIFVRDPSRAPSK